MQTRRSCGTATRVKRQAWRRWDGRSDRAKQSKAAAAAEYPGPDYPLHSQSTVPYRPPDPPPWLWLAARVERSGRRRRRPNLRSRPGAEPVSPTVVSGSPPRAGHRAPVWPVWPRAPLCCLCIYALPSCRHVYRIVRWQRRTALHSFYPQARRLASPITGVPARDRPPVGRHSATARKVEISWTSYSRPCCGWPRRVPNPDPVFRRFNATRGRSG